MYVVGTLRRHFPEVDALLVLCDCLSNIAGPLEDPRSLIPSITRPEPYLANVQKAGSSRHTWCPINAFGRRSGDLLVVHCHAKLTVVSIFGFNERVRKLA